MGRGIKGPSLKWDEMCMKVVGEHQGISFKSFFLFVTLCV